MKKNVFEYNDYKLYLSAVLSSKGKDRGRKSEAAKAAQMQATYLSQILNGHAHLSLEQADLLNHYLLHNEEESHFFILLIQKNKAGTKKLKDYFEIQLSEIRKKRMILTERLGKQYTLSDADKQVYYSSWMYAAVHIAVTIPELQNKKKLCEYLNLKPEKLVSVLDYLAQAQLVLLEGDHIRPGPSVVRLGNDSPNIYKHHSNWRNQAIESLERETLSDLHYSGVFSLSEKDIETIKNILLDNIKNVSDIVRPSKEEKLYVMNLDFFDLSKKN